MAPSSIKEFAMNSDVLVIKSAEQQLLDMLAYVQTNSFTSPVPILLPSYVEFKRLLAVEYSPSVRIEEGGYRFTFPCDKSTGDYLVTRRPGLLAMFLIEHFMPDRVLSLTDHLNICLGYMSRFCSTKTLHLAQLQELHDTIVEMKEKVEFTDASQPPVPRPKRLQKNVDEVFTWIPLIQAEIAAVATGTRTPLKDLVSTDGLQTGQG